MLSARELRTAQRAPKPSGCTPGPRCASAADAGVQPESLRRALRGPGLPCAQHISSACGTRGRQSARLLDQRVLRFALLCSISMHAAHDSAPVCVPGPGRRGACSARAGQHGRATRPPRGPRRRVCARAASPPRPPRPPGRAQRGTCAAGTGSLRASCPPARKSIQSVRFYRLGERALHSETLQQALSQ